jgi:hypothetical protein
MTMMNEEQRTKSKERNDGATNTEPNRGSWTGSLFRRSWLGSSFFVLCSLFVSGGSISAHRLDEYLLAARIDLQTDGVAIELDLTPGVAVAESIIAAIDRDRDGSLAIEEQDWYARAVVSALLVEVDGESLPLQLRSSTFPEQSALRRGEGMIRLQAGAAHRSLSAGAHQLFFRNAHLEPQSVYLANALVPKSGRVSVAAQRRDGDQSELTIDYAIQPDSSFASGWLLVCLTATVFLIRFRR